MKETKAGESEMKGKRGRHRTRREREQMVEAYRASGQTQAVFAHERGLNLTTLRTWIYQRRAADDAGPGRIEPVRIVGGGFSGGTMARSAITVRWPAWPTSGFDRRSTSRAGVGAAVKGERSART